MRTYKHWIKLSGLLPLSQELKGLLKLQESTKIQGCKITVFRSDYNLFDRYFLVEAPHNYNDLELDVNSGSSPLYRLVQKPKNIYQVSKTLDQIVEIINKIKFEGKKGA